MSPKECVFWALNVIDRGHMEPALIALIVAALIALLIFSRLSPALLFTVAMSACVLVGAIDIKTVLAKATNEGLVTLILLLIVSIGLERLPWLLSLSNRLVSRSLPSTLLSLSGLTMLFSAFVNNTAVVATLAGALRKNPSSCRQPDSLADFLCCDSGRHADLDWYLYQPDREQLS